MEGVGRKSPGSIFAYTLDLTLHKQIAAISLIALTFCFHDYHIAVMKPFQLFVAATEESLLAD